MRKCFSPTSEVSDANSPRPAAPVVPLPPHLERKIAAQWKRWEGWVCLHVRRGPNYDPAVAATETGRLRQRHREHILAFTTAGISMRLIRRHQLDDPRITDETRATLVRAMIKRRPRARLGERATWGLGYIEYWLKSHPRDAAMPGAQHLDTPHPASLSAQCGHTTEDLRQTIHAIQKRVSDHFYLRELRDPELKVRSRRQVFTFPRQLAMYLARQLTTATLPEIGRQFGGRHHTTVLHSINKIEQMRRLDEDMNRSIALFIATFRRK